jgi:hypothetical protein
VLGITTQKIKTIALRFNRSLASSKALSWLNRFLAGKVSGALGAVVMTAGLNKAGGTDWCWFVGFSVAGTDTRKKGEIHNHSENWER